MLLITISNIYSIIMKRLYPMMYVEHVNQYAEEYDIESEWIFALIKAESNFDPESISRSGATGLMQIMDETAKEVAEDIGMEDMDLKEPECNIEIGTNYFSSLLEYYNGNYYLAIASYNAGIGTVSKWIKEGIIKEDGTDIENIPYKETNNYVRKVLNNYKIYKELY